MAIEVWWLYEADQEENDAKPNDGAFKAPHAKQFGSLGDAISATANVPPGKHPWISGEGVLFSPSQIKPLRKLKYRP
jgi:hypothetical protein